MIRPNTNLDELVSFLNEALALDPVAMQHLVNHRVSCNQKMADHPTIQVRILTGSDTVLGMIGLLNGLFGINDDGSGPIRAHYNDHGDLIKFSRGAGS